MSEIKFLAYYLPQYHPIPENDEWWGKGFTEWTNVAKAKPLFKGHYQPRLTADLGYYDLRVPEVRFQQAELAKAYGIDGFCYYHYWFGNNKKLLERPLEEVIRSGSPDFPFMLCWANQTWKGIWFGANNPQILIEQKYPGKEDYKNHFDYILPILKDARYITIEGKPVFQVYMPTDITNLGEFVATFKECAFNAGLPGIYLIGNNCPKNWNPTEHGFDAVVCSSFHEVRYKSQKRIIKDRNSILGKVEYKIRKQLGFVFKDIDKRTSPLLLPYEKMDELITNWPSVEYDYFPQVIPDWDNSARSGKSSFVITGSTPEKWKLHLEKAFKFFKQQPNKKNQFVFIKSWNEWAEGNYLEPDQRWGHAYLEAFANVKKQFENDKEN